MSPRLSIVIPVFNEARIVTAAATELCGRLDALGHDYELILTENGSTDATLDLLAALASQNPRIRYLHGDEPNYGRALRNGILDARGELVLCDEIDLCDTDFYARALPLLGQGCDLVVGSKVMRGSNDARPLYRKVATRMITLLLRLVTGFKGTDTHGLKAFRRERLLPVLAACVIERDLFASELVIRAQRMGRDVREIPIALEEKRAPSINLFKRIPRVLLGLWKLGWTIRVKNR